MPSQISQVTPGHMLNSIAPATGGKSDRRDADTARQESSFQSIMGETAAPTADKPEAESAENVMAPMTADDAEQEAGVVVVETPDFVSDDDVFTAEKVESRPDMVQDDSTAEFTLDDIKAITRPVQADAVDKPNAGDAETPDTAQAAEAEGKKSPANGIPAWLVTSLTAEKPLQNEKLSGSAGLEKAIASVAKEAAAPVAKVPSRNDPKAQALGTLANLAEAKNGTTGPVSTETEMRDPTTENAARPKDVTPFIRHADRGALPNDPAKPVPGAEVATARVIASAGAEKASENTSWTHPRAEEPVAGFRSTRGVEPTLPQNTKVAVPPQVPSQNTAPLKVQTKDIGEVRWVSDASFTVDAPAQEAPATSRLQQATLLQQPDLPRNIAVQLAQALRQAGGDRPMELVLNPAELGRVRISMQASEGAMTVQVLADRPETLDLMRRNIDTLAQEFHEMGFGSADFAFGQSMAGGDSADGDSPNADRDANIRPVGDTDDTELTAAPPSLAIHSDRVDIRL